MFVTRIFHLANKILWYYTLFLECPCVLYLQGGRLAMFPNHWPLTSHLLPLQTPKRAMWGDSPGKWTLFFNTVYTSPTAELVWITSKTKRDIDKPDRSGRTQNPGQTDKAAALCFPETGVQEETLRLILVINVLMPFSHLMNVYSFYEPQCRSLFLSEFSLTIAPSRKNERFLHSWSCLFLLDHCTRSYCGDLFIWPSSQTPKVDSVSFPFLFPVPGQVPGIGRCSV